MNLPWKRKPQAAVTANTPIGAIRQLYSHYQKQENLWGYALLSSLVLVFLWIVYSIFQGVYFSYLSLPLAGILISGLQMYWIRGISNTLRQAHAIQQQIDKAEAEKREREDQEPESEEEQASEAGAGDARNGHSHQVSEGDEPDE